MNLYVTLMLKFTMDVQNGTKMAIESLNTKENLTGGELYGMRTPLIQMKKYMNGQLMTRETTVNS